MRRSLNVTDLVSGLLLIAIALFALALAWPLRLGTTFRMGPGYVPRLLCYVQIVLGLVIVLQSFVARGEALEGWAPRPIVLILASVTFFAFAIERFGLVISIIGLVALSSLADREIKHWQALALGVGVAAFSTLVFVTGLGLPIPVMPNLGAF